MPASSSGCFADPTPPATLIARAKDGGTRVLDTVARMNHDYERWSLSGDMLTAIPGSISNNVYWWNVATGDSGVLTMPGPTWDQSHGPIPSYVSAEPDGFLFLTVHGVLKLENTSGAVTRWNKPFNDSDVSYAYAGDSGVVISERGRLRYVKFDDPTTSRGLKDGGSSATKCLGMSKVYAACVLRGVQRPQRYKALALIPLDGSRLIESRDAKHQGTGPVMLAGRKTLFWQRVHFHNGTPRALLTSRTGKRKPVQGTQHVECCNNNVTSAYGKAILTPPGDHKVIAATTARKTRTLLNAPVSP